MSSDTTDYLPANSTDKLQILVVDDNEVFKMYIQNALDHLGYVAVFASDGKECINRLVGESFACVLMDIHMPDMNGHEAATFIRKNLRLDLPIIGTSASAYPEDREKSLHAGMDDHVDKLLSMEQLNNLLKKWIIK